MREPWLCVTKRPNKALHWTGIPLTDEIFDLIRKILAGKHRGEPVVLWDDGRQRRELIDVRDFLRAARALAAAIENQVVNVGSGQEQSIRWYAQQIAEIDGYDAGAIRYDTGRYSGVCSQELAVARLGALLPDFAPTPLRRTLAETIAWSEQALLCREAPE